MVRADQILTQAHLVGKLFPVDHNRDLLARLLVAHVEHLIARPQFLCRIAVAVDAPLHLQRRMVERQGHAVDSSMAGVAPHSFINMNAVIEVDKIGKVIDTVPDERLAAAEALADRLEYRRIRPDLRMAVHAGLGRRDTGKT